MPTKDKTLCSLLWENRRARIEEDWSHENVGCRENCEIWNKV